MKKYFIDMTFYVAKNNLEKMLHDEFRNIEHCTVLAENVKKEIDERYNEIVSRYRSMRGHGKAELRCSTLARQENIQYTIGESLRLNLIPINKEL